MPRYVDRTRWWLVSKYPFLTGSGLPEVVATFELKKDGEAFAKMVYGKKWRQSYEVVKRGY